MDTNVLADLIHRHKSDPESVFNIWFISSEERMKAFRAHKRAFRQLFEIGPQHQYPSDSFRTWPSSAA